MPVNLGFEHDENNLGKNEEPTLSFKYTKEELKNENNVEEQSNNNKAKEERRITKVAILLGEQCYLQQTSIHKLIGVVFSLLLAWAAIFVLIKDAFLPKSDLFQLCFLVLCSYLSGCIFTIIGLPHVVGMFAIGSTLRSIGYFHLSPEYHSASVILRLLAISVTITKAALGVNTDVLLKYKWSIFKYSFIPPTTEAVVFAIMAKFVFKFPWLWAFLFGFVICAMSSAACLNALVNLKNQGIYENDRMKSLIENSAYLDNIYSIAAFTVCLTTVAFSINGEIYVGILYGVLDLIVAFIIGVVLGIISGFFPHKNDEYLVQKRCLVAVLNGTCTYFGCKVIGFPSGGAFSCFTVAATSTFCWKTQGWTISYNPVLNFESKLWNFLMEPLLFGLVGAEIDLRRVDVLEVGTCIWMFIVLIMVRIAVGMLILTGEHYNIREKLFIILSWMPKATVQAALSPQTLDMLRKSDTSEEDELERGRMIIRVSVLAVVTMTTFSSIIIKLSNKTLLSKKATPSETA